MSRVCIYTRVSTDKQAEEGMSLDAQERVCAEWAAQHGHSVAAVYTDEGKSGSSMKKRKALQELLEDSKAKRFDIVVVHKLDRLSRSLRDTLAIMAALEESSVTLVSVVEGQDFSTPMGRMVFTLLVAFAQFFLDNLGGEVRKGNLEKAKQGYFHGKVAPRGYRLEKGALVTHPAEKATVIRAFQLCLANISIPRIVVTLRLEGLSFYDDDVAHPVGENMLHGILENRVYCGDVVIGIKKNRGLPKYRQDFQVFPGKHEAFITREEFEQARTIRKARSRGGRGVHYTARQYIFGAGLLRCNTCGGRMAATGQKKDSNIYYRCSGRWSGLVCEARKRTVREVVLLGSMNDVIAKIAMPEEWHSEIRANALRGSTGDSNADRRKEIEAERERLVDVYVHGRMAKEKYWAKDSVLEAELNSLPVTPVTREQVVVAEQLITDLPELWARADPGRKRELAHLLAREIRIDTEGDKIVAFKPQPSFAFLFALDVDGYVKL